jgi:hypothetical protein
MISRGPYDVRNVLVRDLCGFGLIKPCARAFECKQAFI